MTTLIVGATGATGRLLVEQLLEQGEMVRVVIRSREGLPDCVANHCRLEITEASILSLSDQNMLELVKGCDAVVSCLGHNLTFKGMYGHPRRLVTEAIQRLSNAILKTRAQRPVKFILMNTTGNRNSQADEEISIANSLLIGLIRNLLPPHADNEAAADFLQNNFDDTQDSIEWIAVRPDSLVNKQCITDYTIHPSPVRNPLFDAGKTSRINVANFMSRLMRDEILWQRWKFQMPVIYNTADHCR